MSTRTGAIVHRRKYARCAKGGHEKVLNSSYVCSEHKKEAGPTTHCAVCGTALQSPGNYVCDDHLVRKP